ncbi:aminotransferase class V-fold PLP-dependent enzyme [Psychromonas ossibalaenae]|uniref:aminotransferase class V-fold PLP-dependent enzyme n=1 Tax=Psychromonas ossibalaenae TaxID=444922 RepID=UPI0003662BB4|nr:aminotransferase class V-fold PLP-dependent enzyme [Psychromonas ossibalaenae]
MSENKKNSSPVINRRDFLKTSTGLALAGVGGVMFSGAVQAQDSDPGWHDFYSKSPNRKFWKKVRKEFILDKRNVYMNIGTTGSMPKDVLYEYNRNNKIIASNPWDMQEKFGHWPYVAEMIDAVAPGFGADSHEIILSRNTTDGMCSIINGLHFQEGDVILTTHHEHVAANSPLNVVTKRYGVEVIYLEIPVYTGSELISEQDFVDVFADAVEEYGDRVRLITFSHITYKTGTTLPAKRICHEVAIPNQIPTLIDGAHTIGMFDLDFHDIDCDFYAGSGHKWQCGAGATGILYVRDNAKRLDEYWPDRENPLWYINSSLSHAAYLGTQLQLQYIGNDNYPAKQALTDACLMWDMLGRDLIEKRVLELSRLCKERLLDTFPSASFYSPNTPELSSGLTTFNPLFDQQDIEQLTIFRDRLREEYGYIIRTTDFKVKVTDQSDSHALRISTHLFHNEQDVIGLVEAMQELYLDMI